MAFWHRRNRAAEETRSVSISDPALAQWFGISNGGYTGISIGEGTALTLSAVWRATSLIAQTIASLPLKAYRDVDGVRTRVNSLFDDPNGGIDNQTPFEFLEMIMVHLLLHGDAFMIIVRNGAGGIAGLSIVHPYSVSVRAVPGAPGNRLYDVSLADGSRRTLTTEDLVHIPALSTDGLCGLGVISVARNSLGVGVAGDRAAAKMFSDGALISGLVTPEEDLSEEDANAIRDSLNRKVAGWENASSIAIINRKLKFTPWTMTAEDAQFLQSRQFQIEEVARWFGLPSHMVNLEQKSTSWGTGIESMQRGLSRTVLAPWCARVEQRLSRLLPAPRFVEFDMTGLERGSPAEEIDLLLKQIDGGLLTINEARRVRNLPPLPGGDDLAAAPEPVEVQP